MKLLGLLSLLLAVASSVGSLRGKSSDGTGQMGRRRLGNIYLEYEGVCRKNADGTGSGSRGTNYDVYFRKDDPDVDFAWCKGECEAKESCKAFEYKDDGDASQCELWKTTPKGYVKKNKHVCHVKVERAHHYECHYWNACRKYADGSGKGNSDDEYILYKDVEYYWCEETCSHNSECRGFEYIWVWDKEQCEIWTTEPKGLQEKPSIECCLKVYD